MRWIGIFLFLTGCTTIQPAAITDEIQYDLLPGTEPKAALIEKLARQGYKIKKTDDVTGSVTFLPFDYKIDHGSALPAMAAKAELIIGFSPERLDVVVHHTCIYPFGPNNRQDHPVEAACKEDDTGFQHEKRLQLQRIRAAIHSVAGIGAENVIQGAPGDERSFVPRLDPTVTPPHP